MPADIFKEVLWNDGEGLAFEDLNNAQRFMRALIGDGFVSHAARTGDIDTPGMSTSHLYTSGNAAAPFADNVTNRRSRNLAGVVTQRISGSTPDGSDSQVLSYYLAADEAAFTHPAATVNPRWDVVSVGLAYANADSQSRDFKDAVTGVITAPSFSKQRRVIATVTRTAGAENASPVEPAAPAGHVKLAAFKVTPGMTLFDFKSGEVRDYRMPLGPVSAYEVVGKNWAYSSAAAHTFAADGSLTIPASGSAQGFCPVQGASKRIVEIGFMKSGAGNNAAALTLARRFSLGTLQFVRDLTSLSGNNDNWETFDILANHGEPLWATGYAVGFPGGGPFSVGLGPNGLALEAVASGGGTLVVRGVRFVLVG